VRVWLLSLVASLGASCAFAQSDQVRRGPAPAWVTTSALLPVPEQPSGPLFFRRQEVEAHLSDQSEAQYLGYRVKILQPAALQVGNISIAWNPQSGAPIVHGIKVYRDGQVIDVLKDSSFEILRREDQLEAAKIDGILTAVLRVPDLRVGDELEVELTTFGTDPTLGKDQAGVLYVAASPAPGRYHLGLSWEARKPNLMMSDDMKAAMTASDKAVDFRFDNPPTLSPPKDAPLRFQWQRVVQFSDFADWAAMSRVFSPLYAKAATLDANSPIKLEASRIAAAEATPMGRASAALKLVQQDVRYIYVGLNTGALTPASADETWLRRYGDCKGKSVLLLALLRELGIDAEPVLVNSSGADDGLDQRLPIPQWFDHVLVRAHIDGTDYWLDGTLPSVAPPSTQPVYPLHWVLPLSERGGDLLKLPWRPATTPEDVTLFEIDARAGFDQPAHIVSTQIQRGVKGLQQQVQFSTVSADQLKEAFRQHEIGDTWQTIDDVQWRYDEKAQASILTVTGTGKVSWEAEGKSGKSLVLPGGGFNPPEQRIRPADQAQSAPFANQPEYSCYVTTVRLPPSTQPNQWSSNTSFDTQIFGRDYHRAWEMRDGSIRMIRGSRVEQLEIDAAAAQKDNARIAAFDNSMAVISYDPAGKKAAVGGGESVPATYDFDWTAADAPCLAPAKSHEATVAPPVGHTEPDWLDKPTGDELARVYPRAALGHRVTGSAMLHCIVSTEGYLSDCTIVNETPQDAGFGNAALEATGFMRMKPATTNGVPVESDVAVPVNFQF